MTNIGNRKRCVKISSEVKSLGALFLVVFLLLSNFAIAGTTGKLSGKVTDATSGDPIVGANIIIQGTYLGAAADVDGYYYINNIPPGEYTIAVSAVGYQKTIIKEVQIQIDHTTKLDVQVNSAVVGLKGEVVVTATRPLVQKDLTSTSATVSASDIKMMPVEDVGQIINLQAGVVGGHFRGGRSDEVAYLIDGIPVTDGFNGSMSVEVENASIRQMEVISGTFNAEYGQAMSGVVNIVTQEGASSFHADVSGYIGNYFTTHSDLFQNLNKIGNIPTRNLQLTLSGPAPLPHLSYFITGRYYDNKGYLYGKRVYNVTDDVPFFPESARPNSLVPT